LAFSPVGSVAVPRWGTPSTDRSDSVESCHGKAVTEEFKKVGFVLVSSELEPLHHLTVIPEGCKATFFPYSGEARVAAIY